MVQTATHILLVEDDPAHAELISRAFEMKKQQVHLTVITTLNDARSYLANSTPNLVITDLRLPDGKGIDLLPANNTVPSYPIVIMTSHGDEQVAVEAMKAGAMDYVVKTETTLLDIPRIAQRALREWAHIVERNQMEEELRKLSLAVKQSPVSVIITDTQGNIEYVNSRFTQITGYTFSEVIGKTPRLLKSGNTSPQEYKELWNTIAAGKEWRSEFKNKKKNGELYWESTLISPIRNADGFITHFLSVAEDITARKQMEQNQLELEAQLRQAQKMETVGTLAAGVAHDFNNLLLVINGFAELIQMDLEPDDPHKESVGKILNAGKRAAELVNQLLVFSRKQITKPEIINLESAITKTEILLRRLIGEHIVLETILAPNLWSVKIDPSQLEQIVVNLAINARDAMPNGGKLIIEAANVTLDDDYVAQHLGSQPGKHVLLAVSDTGLGMSKEMKTRIFEPFFTTKEVGKGTGLGLATVFGIVKQSQGNIWVYSEEGIGTTFKIYLPGVEITRQQSTDKNIRDELPQGHETVLLVEDDTGVRKLTRMVLQGQGFTILEAKDGNAALQLALDHTGPIHLLLTDVVMPGLSGKALSQELAQTHPNLKTLFMSGYTDNAVVHHGILDSNAAFLQKPFSPKTLLYKVRTVLDA